MKGEISRRWWNFDYSSVAHTHVALGRRKKKPEKTAAKQMPSDTKENGHRRAKKVYNCKKSLATARKQWLYCHNRPNKKRSLLRLTWLKFLRAGGRFFFCWKFFTCTRKSGANLYFSRAGNSNSGTGSLAARRTSLPESPRPRVCVGRLATLV